MSFGFRLIIAAIACSFALPAQSIAQPIEDFYQEGEEVAAGLMIKVAEGKWARGELESLVLRLAQENSVPIVKIEERTGWGGWWHLEFPKPMQLRAVRPLVEQLRLLPRIKNVEINSTTVTSSTPNDDAPRLARPGPAEPLGRGEAKGKT